MVLLPSAFVQSAFSLCLHTTMKHKEVNKMGGGVFKCEKKKKLKKKGSFIRGTSCRRVGRRNIVFSTRVPALLTSLRGLTEPSEQRGPRRGELLNIRQIPLKSNGSSQKQHRDLTAGLSRWIICVSWCPPTGQDQ